MSSSRENVRNGLLISTMISSIASRSRIFLHDIVDLEYVSTFGKSFYVGTELARQPSTHGLSSIFMTTFSSLFSYYFLIFYFSITDKSIKVSALGNLH